jgi:hypothetical protein
MGTPQSWKRDDLSDLSRYSFLQIAATKERGMELAELNLPGESCYLLVPFENGQWAWLYGADVEIHVTPAVKVPRRKSRNGNGCDPPTEDDA